MNQNDDDTTVTTTASSFVHVVGHTGCTTTTTTSNTPPLSISIQPHHDTIGVEALDANSGSCIKYVTDHVCVTLKAHERDGTNDDDEQEAKEERAPVDIVVALDLSGSMRSRGKINLCKKTLDTMVRALQPQDRFGLVTYASDARVTLPLQRLNVAYKKKCLDTIAGLQTRDGTNISAGLGLAAQEMQTVETPNQVRSVFLLTDGEANEGICHTTGLVQLVQNCLGHGGLVPPPPTQVHIETSQEGGEFMGWMLRFDQTAASTSASAATRTPGPTTPAQADFTTKSQIPITLHTFGYGQHHNDDLLQKMTQATEGGTYYFVENDMGVNDAFGDAIGGIVSVVAQNSVVHLIVPPEAAAMGVTIEKVHHDQVIPRENGSYTVTVGDFYAEESRDVVLTVKLARPTEANITNSPIPHVSAKVCYTDTLQRRPVESSTVTASIARPVGAHLSAENDHVAAQWLRVFSVEQMARAEAYAQSGNFDAAQASLATVTHTYHRQSASVQAHIESASVFESTVSMVDDMSAGAEQYRAVGSKRARQSLQSHRYQRSSAMTTPRPTTTPAGAVAAAPSAATLSPYDTKSKTSWRSKFS